MAGERAGVSMPRAVIVALVLLGGCDPNPAPPPAAKAPPAAVPDQAATPATPGDLGQAHAAMMETMAQTVVAKAGAAADDDYDTFEDAMAALDTVLPDRSFSAMDEVLAEKGIARADMAAFMRAHPEDVAEVGARVEEILATAEPDMALLMGKAIALAPAEDGRADGIVEQLISRGYGDMVARALRWIDVASGPGLEAAFKVAQGSGKGLLIDVRAQWCMPCKELESKTFAEPHIAAALLRGFVTVKLDVTEADDAATKLQERLGATTLPRVLIWKVGDAAPGADLGAPSETVTTFVTATEFATVLDRVMAVPEGAP